MILLAGALNEISMVVSVVTGAVRLVGIPGVDSVLLFTVTGEDVPYVFVAVSDILYTVAATRPVIVYAVNSPENV
jgi:hypothetical protein